MPKEIIRTTPSQRYAVEVRWARDMDVKIATVDPELTDADATGRGWYADLTRAGINELIRVLRRARDAAYGADA